MAELKNEKLQHEEQSNRLPYNLREYVIRVSRSQTIQFIIVFSVGEKN